MRRSSKPKHVKAEALFIGADVTVSRADGDTMVSVRGTVAKIYRYSDSMQTVQYVTTNGIILVTLYAYGRTLPDNVLIEVHNSQFVDSPKLF